MSSPRSHSSDWVSGNRNETDLASINLGIPEGSVLATWSFRGPAIELGKAYQNIKIVCVCVCVFIQESRELWQWQEV